MLLLILGCPAQFVTCASAQARCVSRVRTLDYTSLPFRFSYAADSVRTTAAISVRNMLILATP